MNSCNLYLFITKYGFTFVFVSINKQSNYLVQNIIPKCIRYVQSYDSGKVHMTYIYHEYNSNRRKFSDSLRVPKKLQLLNIYPKTKSLLLFVTAFSTNRVYYI